MNKQSIISTSEELVRRSKLFVPVNNPVFVQKCWTRGADVIIFDLEDSVPLDKKSEARLLVKDFIPLGAKGGSDVFVRINKEFAYEDLKASVWPGLTGIVFPKAESSAEIDQLDTMITDLEIERKMTVGNTQMDVLLETAKGIWNAYEIASSTKRIVSICVGAGDLAFDLEIPMVTDADQYAYSCQRIIIVATALGIQAHGLVPLAAFTRVDIDSTTMLRAATMGRMLGFKGAACIHPSWVKPLNEGFSISEIEIKHARRIVEVFHAIQGNGFEAAKVDNVVYDARSMKCAKALLSRAEAIANKEANRGMVLKV